MELTRADQIRGLKYLCDYVTELKLKSSYCIYIKHGYSIHKLPLIEGTKIAYVELIDDSNQIILYTDDLGYIAVDITVAWDMLNHCTKAENYDRYKL